MAWTGTSAPHGAVLRADRTTSTWRASASTDGVQFRRPTWSSPGRGLRIGPGALGVDQALVVLGVDDEDPGRGDGDHVDAGPRSGDPPVVEDDHALALDELEAGAGPPVALGPLDPFP